MEEKFKKRREEIKDLLLKIQGDSLEGSSYSFNKQSISTLFEKIDGDTEEGIFLRLAIIDSMYSTQMNKRYYALEDLAKTMFAIGTEKKCPLAKLFTDFAEEQDAMMFNYGGENLFGKSYGVSKFCQQSKAAISLISKYAYYETIYKFPIYDSIVVHESLPSLCDYLNIEKREIECKEKDRLKGEVTMKNLVEVIKEFFKELGIDVCYDSFDRLLWFVGKIRRGNLSLILSKDEYVRWIKTHKIENEEDVVFDVAKDSYEDISPFLNPKNQELMEQFFKMAKEFGPVKKYKKKSVHNVKQ